MVNAFALSPDPAAIPQDLGQRRAFPTALAGWLRYVLPIGVWLQKRSIASCLTRR